MPQVHRLIRELAIYEKAETELHTSAEQFAEDGFGEEVLFECFVAENEAKEIVGTAFFYVGYSTWKGKKMYLDDLVVTESYRRQKIGQLLFDRLVRYAFKCDVQQLRWHVLDWNTPAIRMYEKLEASLEDDWITCKLNRKQLEAWK